MQIDLAKDFGLALNTSKMPEWTQDCVAERDIDNGVIIAEDRSGKTRYIKIIEIIPINFMIMTEEEQNGVIRKYFNLIKTGPENFHIKIITDVANLDDYVTMARKAYEKEKNERCKEMITDYISFLLEEGGLDSYKKHYYFIFELEEDDLKGITSQEEAVQLLKVRTQELRNAFRQTGNNAILLDPDPKTEKKLLGSLLYNYYNRRSKESESFEARVKRMQSDMLKVQKLLPEMAEEINFDMKNVIAPRSIDFCESPSYVVIDGMYKSHFFVDGKSIPNYMNTTDGWLTAINNFGYGYDIDIYFQKADTQQKLNSIKTNLKVSSFKNQRTEDESLDADDTRESYSGQMYLKSALKAARLSVYDMSILITVWAHTKKELAVRKEAMKKAATRIDVEIYECKRYQEDAFYSTGYTMDLRPKLFSVARRNLTTAGVAAAYPFTSFSMADKEGIAIGYNLDNGSLVMYDQFDHRYTNANMAIFGKSGGGKSFALMTMIMRLRYHGIQNFILAPEKQHEFLRLTSAVGGEFIDLASTSSQRINPLEIIPMSSPEMELLNGEDYQEKAWMVDKCDALKIWLGLLIPGITPGEEAVLDSILVKLYNDFGITENNDSIYVDAEKTKVKKMPIISDLYERVCDSVRAGNLRRDIADVLSKFITGSARNMNGETNVDLSNKLIVFGLQNIDKKLLAPTMFIILQFVWARSRQNIAEKKMITIDEGWKLLKDGNKEVGEFVEEIFKVIRGYGGGAIFASQFIKDVLRDRFGHGEAILSNSEASLLFGMKPADRDITQAALHLSDEDMARIATFERGEGMFFAGANHIPIKVEASAEEYLLFTTNRKDKEKQLEQLQTS